MEDWDRMIRNYRGSVNIASLDLFKSCLLPCIMMFLPWLHFLNAFSKLLCFTKQKCYSLRLRIESAIRLSAPPLGVPRIVPGEDHTGTAHVSQSLFQSLWWNTDGKLPIQIPLQVVVSLSLCLTWRPLIKFIVSNLTIKCTSSIEMMSKSRWEALSGGASYLFGGPNQRKPSTTYRKHCSPHRV